MVDHSSASTPRPPVGRLNDPPALTALTRLFLGDHASPEVVWFSVPGGRALYSAGDEADMLYLVRAGRLGVLRSQDDGANAQFLGVIKQGEPAGEMALIAGTPHSATVVALRDSEVLALPRRAFFAAARKDPALMAEMARLTIVRSRQPVSSSGLGAPRVLAFIGVSEGPSIRPLVEAVERELVGPGVFGDGAGRRGSPRRRWSGFRRLNNDTTSSFSPPTAASTPGSNSARGRWIAFFWSAGAVRRRRSIPPPSPGGRCTSTG